MKAKVYFYARGQSARAKGMSKVQAEEKYLSGAPAFARIYFDKGYRGLAM